MLSDTFVWIDGLWFWLTQGDGGAALLGGAALACTATFGIGWLSRARAARRFHAVLDAYAEREIDRERRRDELQSVRRAVSVVAARQ
jgi:hypothetical protein